MEVTRSSETLVLYLITAWSHDPEDHEFNLHHHKNPKFHYCNMSLSEQLI